VASILGQDAEAVEAFEQGQEAISLPQIEILSQVYGVSLRSFWDTDIFRTPIPRPVESTSAYVGLRRKMIGVLLRQARLTRGKTLTDLAAEIDRPSEELAAVEFGENDISIAELEQLAHNAGVSLAYFANPDLESGGPETLDEAEVLKEMPEDVREFLAQPANVLYVRLAMVFSELPVDTLRRIGEGLLDITL
jgi:transcriptional regulator with XRE-family HTH domain